MNRISSLVSLGLTVAMLSACGGGGSTPPLPTAQSAAIQLDEDRSFSGTLAGAAQSGGALSFQLISQPSHGDISVTGNSYTYTPDPDFNGNDQFTFKTLENGRSSTAATVTITVSPVNDAPTLGAQTLQLNEDENLQFSAAGQDIDGDNLSVSIVTGPVHGTITLSADQTLEYTPFENYFGEDQLTIIISDGLLKSDPAIISLEVAPVNDAPTASYTDFDIYSGKSFRLDTQVSDVESDPVSVAILRKPDEVTLADGLGSDHSGLFRVEYGKPISSPLTLVFDDGQDQSTLEIPLPLKVENTEFSEKHAALAGEYAGGLVRADQALFAMTTAMHGNSNIIQFSETSDQPEELGRVNLGKRVLFNAGFNHSSDAYFLARSDSFESNGSLNFYQLRDITSLTQQSATVTFEGTRQKSIVAIPAENGYLVIGSDNKAHRYDAVGNLLSTHALPALPIDGVINEVFDIESTDDGFRFFAGIWGCGDSSCNSRTGYGSALLVYSSASDSIQMSDILTSHYQDALFFEGQLFAAGANGVAKYNIEGSSLNLEWKTDQSLTYGESSLVATDKGIYIGTVYDDSGIQFSRLDNNGNVIWSDIHRMYEEGSFRGWDLAALVDPHGNAYLRYVLRSDTHSPLGYLVHWDFLGRRQWLTAISPNDTEVIDMPRANSILFGDETEIITLNQTSSGGITTTRISKTTIDRNLD